jgi:hypothetical protein
VAALERRAAQQAGVRDAQSLTNSDSPWFFGRYGFVLHNARALPFTPWRGELGFFNVPDSTLQMRHES